ncbi:2,4-dichlorophenol 6-monooxygenase [Cladophialophora carrionii]|uniref:2,4-dichlorophenol 6-monooxygenase n=1 Tax=Cladophialophora carrionii TaxID=86049 RepID=A0A1C1C656_9EURO|nr:2,4-dichlorophenol 6-monooxygenase [Cladophialophora carrionii]
MSTTSSQTPDIVTDVLIIGTGPCGGSLAAFLARYNINTTLIDKAPSTTADARAHFTNMATVECFRDIGLEKEILRLGTSYDNMPFRRYCHTVHGLEYFRGKICNQVPEWKHEYDTASPCQHIDLPQNDAEAIFTKWATQTGYVKIRYNTEYVAFVDHGTHVLATCHDLQTNKPVFIQARFLCGADGGRSKLISQIGATLTGPREDMQTCYSVDFTADLTPVAAKCPAFFHFVFRPAEEFNAHCMVAIIRTVRPWHRFQLITIPVPGTPVLKDVNAVDWKALIADILGDPALPIEVDRASKWRVNEVVADYYSKGNVFCLGDAVHRHPPANGLGSNTSIQDSYNLAWKLAYVLNGTASTRLLDSYSCERQPVGKQVVTRANDSLRNDMRFYAAMGMTEPDVQKRRALIKALGEDSEGGRELRTELQQASALTQYQFSALGAEMNQFYRSDAIYSQDESADTRQPVYADIDMRYERGTLPGMRLPHAWLATTGLETVVSTHDLAGKGRFTIFTGIGGKEVWDKAAATTLQQIPHLPIAVVSIGWGQEYIDTDNTWGKVRGVDEAGAVLVRPDRFVCWRSQRPMNLEEAAGKLNTVLRRVLGWD